VVGPPRAKRFDIADIVRAHRGELEAAHWLSARQRRVLTDIAQCRTEALGGHLEQCSACDHQQTVYLSCRNRHCPKCQALAQEKWIDDQRERMLDVTHFHVVFTLPAELRPLAAFAPRVLYNALFHAASNTLLEFGTRNLNATVGATVVLHTWTRELMFHPHVHALVTTGGLELDGTSFIQRGRAFLFPVRAMALVFRAKFLGLLWQAHRAGAFARFDAFQDPQGFQALVNRLPKRWHVYAKPSFDSSKYVLAYLGRYTHRVGIANSRLLQVTSDAITFRTKNDRTETLRPVEFLRRLVQHVLPDGFHKIRHVGLYASPSKCDQARQLLAQPMTDTPPVSWQQRLLVVIGKDVSRCPHCNAPVRCVPLPGSRAPPARLQPCAAA
jgi:hypothetical protein